MQTQTLRLYSPHQGQLKGHQSTKRFNILCWGRQSGKTTYGLNKISQRAWEGRKDGIYWYILQTYDAAHVAFKRLFKFYRASPLAFDKKPNESDLLCRFKHGPEISFKSGRNFEDLRIETLDGCIIDEYRQQPPELWPLVIRPMLGRRQGWADILSTANGFDHFKDLFDLAQNDPEWGWFHAPSTVAPWWTPSEIASAKSVMSEDEFAQEILADFREIGKGKAYKRHGPWNQVTENPFAIRGYDWAEYIPILVGLDFNVGLMAWELGQYKGGDFHFEEEISQENTDTEQMALLLAERVKNHKPGVVLVGDSTGNARKTSSVGKTDYTIISKILTEKGIRFENRTPSENPLVKDRINMVNSRLKSADGSVHFTYNVKKCKRLKTDLERVTIKQGVEGFALDKKNPLLTHASDAAGYPICYFSDEWKAKPGIMRVIVR